jgi:exodeoxyribonuclease V alpha subunit
MQITGLLRNITFHNPDTGYTVLKLEQDDKSIVTVTGSFPVLRTGEILELEGSNFDHPRFGSQFQAVSFKIIPPKTTDALCKYLASGLFAGIGYSTALKMLDLWGESVLDILEEDPKKISRIPGMGKKKVDKFVASWKENIASRDLLYFCTQQGISVAVGMRIFKHYGSQSLQILRENPYILAEEVWGIGFMKADDIACKMGIAKNSYYRLKAALLYVLEQSAKEGHVYLPQLELLNTARNMLQHPETENLEERLIFSLDELLQANKIYREEEACYLPYLYYAETGIAKHVQNRITGGVQRDLTKLEKVLHQFESKQGIAFSQEQKDCILHAVTKRFFILTGGPGTGKTTTLRGILYLLAYLEKSFLLGAPTGRAAKRMAEVTGFEAKTLHRLLEYNPTNQGFTYNADLPLKTDVVIIDEVSMVDTSLMYSVMKALDEKTSLILVGDKDQLPSVGPGNIMRELLLCPKVHHGVLNQVYRQGAESMIAVNAHRINRGEMPEFPFQTNFHLRSYDSPEHAQTVLTELVSKHLPTHFGVRPLEDIQVLAPMRRGLLGTEELNKVLQDALNPSKLKVPVGSNIFKPGDKVMCLKNDYERMVYNGDVGYIQRIHPEKKLLWVQFDDVEHEYAFSQADSLILAYATTIHKSQGSEFPIVILIMDSSHYLMLQRNLFYTGITRAKNRAFVLSSLRNIQIAVKNNKTIKRYTRLSTLIRSGEEFFHLLDESEDRF